MSDRSGRENLLGAAQTLTETQEALANAQMLWNVALEQLDAAPTDTQEHIDARFAKLSRDIEALHALLLAELRKAGK